MQTTSEVPVFTAYNQHDESCGSPPAVSNTDPDFYHGYFENVFGEQWVFVYNRQAQRATLRGGDIGWEREVPVIDGMPVGIVLNFPEQVWLGACLDACGLAEQDAEESDT